MSYAYATLCCRTKHYMAVRYSQAKPMIPVKVKRQRHPVPH